MKYLKTLDQFISESLFVTPDQLDEKLIVFNNKPYQPFGNVVIMAGGAGSGKGFIKDKLIGLEGWSFDVDELKTLAMNSKNFANKAKQITGVDITKMNLKNPDDVASLHNVVNDVFGTDEKKMSRMYASVLTAAPDRKPNLIFDVTLKNIKKLNEISKFAIDLGYDTQHIHIVWVVNHIEVAKQQNKERDRVVPENILFGTHEGASSTMLNILSMGDDLKNLLDGDIVFAFAQAGVDTVLLKKGQSIPSEIGKAAKTGTAMYLKDAFYVYVKRAGRPPINPQEIADNIIAKIDAYTPLKWSNQ